MTAFLPQATQLTLDDIARQCADGLPLPSMNEGFVFAEPWQAHAFAMTLQLHEKGVFTWPEWAAALTHEIRQVDVTRFCRHISTSSSKLLKCHRAQLVKMTVPADSIVKPLNVIKHV